MNIFKFRDEITNSFFKWTIPKIYVIIISIWFIFAYYHTNT